MKLTIDTIRCTIRSDKHGEIQFERHYDLDAEHRFIIWPLGSNGVLIKIKEGKKRIVQQGIVRFMSATAGSQPNSEPRPQNYEVTLHPDLPIYPLGAAVDAVLEMGIVKGQQISPMFHDRLRECVADDLDLKMVSDGDIVCRALADEGKTLEEAIMSRVDFTVSNATWAIMSFGTKVSHVYLWAGAEYNLAAIRAAIGKIQNG